MSTHPRPSGQGLYPLELKSSIHAKQIEIWISRLSLPLAEGFQTILVFHTCSDCISFLVAVVAEVVATVAEVVAAVACASVFFSHV